MSYTNSTEFYGIPLPEETDLVNPMDDNEAKERIDTALHGAEQNASGAVETANAASDAAAAATSGLESLSETVNTEKGKLTALTARVTAVENEIDDVRSDGQDAICAYNEPTATSTHAYAIGDYFFYNNVLYRATAAIAIGDTIVPNTNCEARNVTSDLIEIKTALADMQVKLIASVTADGVKTRKQLLDELHVQAYPIANYVLGRTEFRRGNTTFLLTDNTSAGYVFTTSEVSSAHLNVFAVTMKTDSSVFAKWEMSTVGNAYTDSSAIVEQNGTIFAIYN